jgi:probable rRNA maturation factor
MVTDESGRARRAPALAGWLERIAPARARGAVTIALVDDRTIRRLNRTFAGLNRVTDVLSFPVEPRPGPARRPATTVPGSRARRPATAGTAAAEGGDDRKPELGDIVIATGVARRQAREAGHSYSDELRILALHGLLHLLGYDHHVDGGQMARLETRLLRKGGLRAGVIERARPA